MRILAPLILLLALSQTVQADFVTLLPASSRSLPSSNSLETLADTFGKSVTVRYLDADFGRSGNLDPSDTFLSQSSNLDDKLFGFQINAVQQANCDFSEDFNSDQLAMAGELPAAVTAASDQTQLAMTDDFSWLYNQVESSDILSEAEEALAMSAFGGEGGMVMNSDDALNLELANHNSNDLFAMETVTQSLISSLSSGSRTNSLLAGELGTIPGSLDLILAVGSGGNGIGGSGNAGVGGGGGNPMRDAEVPEPSTVILLLIGLCGGFCYRRKIMSRKAA